VIYRMTYDKLSKKPSLLQNFTSLSLQAFRDAHEGDLREREAQREAPRQRQAGGGRSANIATIEDKLVFILFYFPYKYCKVIYLG
jgi:hypothetical protein